MLKLIFDSVVEFIRITKEELMISPELRKEFKARAITMVKLMVTHFHHRMFNHANANYFTLKFQRSLKKDSINLLKKILIFLREAGEESKKDYGRDVHHTEVCVSQLRQVIVRVLSYMPKPQQIRDFFSFFREIFYYNKKLDEVDFLLT